MKPYHEAKPRILVTSAAGKTGLPLTLQLLEAGYPVRAFVRRDDDRASRLREAGAEIFVGNLLSLADMRKAMADVRRAYHCAPTAANGLHFGAVFAVAAREAGLEHVVTLSQWLAHPDHPSVATREVWLNDELVALLPEASHTVIDVGWFAANYFMVLESAAQLGLLPMPLGDGDVKKDAPPSNEDIAAVAAAALTDPAAHAGKRYRPTGPALLSPNDIAAALSDALGRRVRYRDIPEATFLKALKSLGLSNFSDFMMIQLRLYAEEYRRGAFAAGAPSDAVERATGRAPEDFAAIARRMVAERPVALRSPSNRLRALRNFARILVTPVPDIAAIARHGDQAFLAAPAFALDSPEWDALHDPAARAVTPPLAAVATNAAA